MRQALKQINAWDEPHIRLVRAVLEDFDAAHDGDAASFVLHEVRASSDAAEATENVARLLARLAALESGSEPSRAATRELDRQAVAALATHGLGPDERARVQALVDTVVGPTRPPVVVAQDVTERQNALYALRRWYDKWSEIARAFIARRDVLILLGLAQRRRSSRADADLGDDAASGTAPADIGAGGGAV